MSRIRAKIFHLARSIESVIGDWWMHIHSRGSVYFEKPRGQNQDANDFETITHSSIIRTIQLVKPNPDDVVFILGCGKGRALCHFARQRVHKVVGIEISESLSKIARTNARTLRKPHAPIQIRNTDAAITDLGHGTVFFMFNPFGERTLRNVLKNIQKSHNVGSPPLRIICMNSQFPHVFDEFPWLEVAFDYRRLNAQRVIIYRSRKMHAHDCQRVQLTDQKEMRRDHKEQIDDGSRITTIRSIEQIENIRPIWEQIQANEPYPVINADIDRYLSVLKGGGDDVQPYIMLIEQNSHPTAMAIGRIGTHLIKLELGYKTLVSLRLRCLTIVYGGILGQQTSEVCTRIVYELMKLLRGGEAQVIFFNQLRVDSLVYQAARTIPGFFHRSHLPRISPHWSVSIPKNMEQFYQSFPRKHRSNLRRLIRKLEKTYPNQVKLVNYQREDQLEEAMSVISQISARTYQRALGYGFVCNGQTLHMLTTAAKLGWFRAHVLYVGDEPCAFQLALKYGGTYFGDQTGYDPKWNQFRVGTILFLKLMQRLCCNPEIDSFDFGFGDAEYKHSYANKQWHEGSLYIFGPRFYPIFINLLRTATIGLNVGLKYVANKTAVLGRVKRRWRNLLQARSVESRPSEGR